MRDGDKTIVRKNRKTLQKKRKMMQFGEGRSL